MGDNLDKTVKPTVETSEHHTQSLHYFHGYAVKDRVDVSKLEDDPYLPDLSQINVETVLPKLDDESSLKSNMAILAAQVIRKRIPLIKKHFKPVVKHISHIYTSEMSQKSEVVSGIVHHSLFYGVCYRSLWESCSKMK